MTLRTLSVVMSHVSYFWPLNLMGWNSMNVSGCYPLRPLLSEQGQHGPDRMETDRQGLNWLKKLGSWIGGEPDPQGGR